MSSARGRFQFVTSLYGCVCALVLAWATTVAAQADTAPDGTPLVCRAFGMPLDDPTGTSKMCGDYQLGVNKHPYNPKLNTLTITRPDGKQSRYFLATMRKNIAYLLHDAGQNPAEATVVVTYGDDESLRFYVGKVPFANAVATKKVQPLSSQ